MWPWLSNYHIQCICLTNMSLDVFGRDNKALISDKYHFMRDVKVRAALETGLEPK